MGRQGEGGHQYPECTSVAGEGEAPFNPLDKLGCEGNPSAGHQGWRQVAEIVFELRLGLHQLNGPSQCSPAFVGVGTADGDNPFEELTQYSLVGVGIIDERGRLLGGVGKSGEVVEAEAGLAELEEHSHAQLSLCLPGGLFEQPSGPGH